MACIQLWSSAVRVDDSQAYRKLDVTRECISCILELREILLSFQTAYYLIKAAVVCAILQSTSGVGPSSVITESRYLKLVTVWSFYPFTLISVLMTLVLFAVTSPQFASSIDVYDQKLITKKYLNKDFFLFLTSRLFRNDDPITSKSNEVTPNFYKTFRRFPLIRLLKCDCE